MKLDVSEYLGGLAATGVCPVGHQLHPWVAAPNWHRYEPKGTLVSTQENILVHIVSLYLRKV